MRIRSVITAPSAFPAVYSVFSRIYPRQALRLSQSYLLMPGSLRLHWLLDFPASNEGPEREKQLLEQSREAGSRGSNLDKG